MLREISDEQGRITSKLILDHAISYDLTPYEFEYSQNSYSNFPITPDKLTATLFENGFIEEDETGEYEYQIAKEYRK